MRELTSDIESLSGLDGAFLNLETMATPMHVGSLHTFEVPKDYQGDFFTDDCSAVALVTEELPKDSNYYD